MEAFIQPRYEPNYTAFKHSLNVHEMTRQTTLQGPASTVLAKDTMAWSGRCLGDAHIIVVDEQARKEIRDAAKVFAESRQSLNLIDKTTFQLRTQASTLRQARKTLHSYPGLVLIRGLKTDESDARINAIIAAGLSAHFSEMRGRQAGGKHLVHVKNLDDIAPKLKVVAPYSNRWLPYHTDKGDLVSMLVLSSGLVGGNGIFASVAEICRHIAQRAPDLLGELLAPEWPFDVPGNPHAIQRRPLLYLTDHNAEMNFSRGSLIFSPSSQRAPDLPGLSSKQYEALEWVHWIAEQHSYHLNYEDGDFVIFNNRRILHGRDSFQDHAASARNRRPRHFLRLWLKDEAMAGPAPGPLQEIWDKIFKQPVEEEDECTTWPLAPISKENEAIPTR